MWQPNQKNRIQISWFRASPGDNSGNFLIKLHLSFQKKGKRVSCEYVLYKKQFYWLKIYDETYVMTYFCIIKDP